MKTIITEECGNALELHEPGREGVHVHCVREAGHTGMHEWGSVPAADGYAVIVRWGIPPDPSSARRSV